MDDDFWLKVYRGWATEALEKEIGTCHLYQQSLLYKVSAGSVCVASANRLMITSQCREYLIHLVIRERIEK